MIIADINKIEGRGYSAGRRTRPFAGQGLPIDTERFCMGWVELEPKGGQVPWHNQEQEEIYFLLEGTCEMCLGSEREIITGGQVVHISPGQFHQLTNIGETSAKMIYCYAPAGEVAHWKQELTGTLPRAGTQAPPLPRGAHPQHVDK